MRILKGVKKMRAARKLFSSTLEEGRELIENPSKIPKGNLADVVKRLSVGIGSWSSLSIEPCYDQFLRLTLWRGYCRTLKRLTQPGDPPIEISGDARSTDTVPIWTIIFSLTNKDRQTDNLNHSKLRA
jgi:hypothetical protein